MVPDAVRVALAAARVLEEARVGYLIGGSIASTLYGEPRSTQDVDFVVHLRQEALASLIRALERSEFYFHPNTVREAISGWPFFALVHKRLFVKVDVYVRPDEGIHREEMKRAHRVQIGDSPDETARLATAEDTLIQKLLWYRMGEGMSDRQWRDVLGILKRRGQQLDMAYLERWSRELGLAELLARARSEAGRPESAT